jgi:hypothetical protein
MLLTLKGDIVSVGDGEGAAGAVIFLERPRRLARPRTPPFHGDNMGSNPIGDTNKDGTLRRVATVAVQRIWHFLLHTQCAKTESPVSRELLASPFLMLSRKCAVWEDELVNVRPTGLGLICKVQ